MPFKLKNSVFILSALLISQLTQAQLTAISDDGREVILREDGQWEYLSTDRFANTSDGRRIRLKQDGQWEYSAEPGKQSAQQFINDAITVKLDRVEIEEFKELATSMRKNSRVTTQTSFYFTATASSLGQTAIPILNSGNPVIDGFSVTDDRGGEYSIIELSPSDAETIKPGESITYNLKISASPKWGPDIISLHIDKKVFSSDKDIVLSMPVDNIPRVSGK